MKCQAMVKGLPEHKRVNGGRVVPCSSKATLFVAAYGGKSWSGFYCSKHGPRIIAKRMRLITKYKQSVVLRRITDYDRKARKERMGKQ